MKKSGFVYILANYKNGTIYVGVTADLEHRVWEHKTEKGTIFTKKYKIDKLVYYEEFELIGDAILKEKQIKKWNRKWKIELIEKENINWKDLYEEIKSELF